MSERNALSWAATSRYTFRYRTETEGPLDETGGPRSRSHVAVARSRGRSARL